ncbi:heme exporter protein CcmD [Jannaschia aquimarina]|uniref:Heme exporter protein D n=1 Tax=Jannaschia aquimarina TaxID=935700 RepID=A0A0D1EI98_9RHOB|nr:heme exporter protein CcmD [Jannaschia aquimarina]KIT17314.1 Heme exporter protein D (CcmD) [Jannaschia aquimarina]SNT20140.1 heme exporter protein CcmD [Jannaschia aquimarina]
MSLDFGRYAFDVWLALGVSAVGIGGLILQSVLASRAVRARLEEEEQ